jgi:colicin import membrane protein
MQTAADRSEFAPPRQDRWGRPLTLALVVHGALIAALTWGVQWKQDAEMPAVEAELWSRLPQQAAPRAVEPPPPPPPEPEPEPKPAPAPEPKPVVKAPPPPPPAPSQADIAMAKAKEKAEAEKKAREEAARKEKEREKKLAEEKREREKKLAAEKAEKAEKEREKKLAEEKREREKKLAEEKREREKKAADDKREAQLKEQLRQDQLKRMMGQAGATGSATSTGTAQQSSGPTPGYGAKVAARIKPNIVFTESAPGNPRAEVEVRTLPDGTITSRRITKSSGNPAWDDAVLRAIDRTATLPRDTDGRVPSSLVIGLRPLD